MCTGCPGRLQSSIAATICSAVSLSAAMREKSRRCRSLCSKVSRESGAPTRLWPATTMSGSRAAMESMLAIHASRAVASVRAVSMCTWL